MKRALFVAILSASLMHVVVGADPQQQPGPNNNVVSGALPGGPDGISASDPVARVKTDLLMQRQNEAVIAASTRNPDHLLAAANDYRTIEISGDAGIGEADNSFIAKLIAKLFGRKPRNRVPAAATAAEAWLGVYRSCDRGRTWIGSLFPGSPSDSSPASMASPLKGLDAATDAVMAPLPGGVVVVGGLGFTRGGLSKIFAARYIDKNNREGGACFTYEANSTKVIATGARSATGSFADKPAIASDTRNGKNYVYMSYTVFTGEDSSGRTRSKLNVARSWDGGKTWTSVTPKVNRTFLRSQGSAIAVDPQNGHVYVFWRLFYDNRMVMVKSTDFGVSWGPVIPITDTLLQPFDQPTTVAETSADYGSLTFRSLGFPTVTAAIVKVNGNDVTKLFAAWQERVDANGQPAAGGSPRIVLTTSIDGGVNWTQRKAVDIGPRNETEIARGPTGPRDSGQQVEPALSSNGGRVMLLYYEARGELGSTGYIDGILRQMDARVAEIDPASGELLGSSVQVSEYFLDTTSTSTNLLETVPGFAAVNRPNLPMYKGGTAPFVGDYTFLAPAVPLVTGSPWKWATDPLVVPGPSFHAVFNDNRNIQYPLKAGTGPAIDGDWTKYKPASSFDPSAAGCENPRSRNADIFHSEINDGLVAGSPQPFKQLGKVVGGPADGELMQRAFVFYVENRTPDADRSSLGVADSMFVRMTIEDDDNTDPGVDANFLQFDVPSQPFQFDEDDVAEILPYSSITRTVFAKSAIRAASFRVHVQETDGLGGPPKEGGRKTVIVFNPDDTNPDLTVGGATTPPIGSNEFHNPKIVGNPKISTINIKNPQLGGPQLGGPQLGGPQLGGPQLGGPQLGGPQLGGPQLGGPQLGGIAFGGEEVTFTVVNEEGNTTSTYNALLNVPNYVALLGSYDFQVLVTKTTLVPGVAGANGCQNVYLALSQVISNIAITAAGSQLISNPQLGGPQLGGQQPGSPQLGGSELHNATFSIAPAVNVEGENSHGEGGEEDNHSLVWREEIKVSVRAIRKVENAPPIDLSTTALRVDAQAANVVNGVVPDSKPPSDFSGPDLSITADSPTVMPTLVVGGDTVQTNNGTITNEGDANAIPFDIGYVLSSINPAGEPVVLTSVPDSGENGLASGASENFDAKNVVIPIPTVAGTKSLSIVADVENGIGEADRTNNAVAGDLVVVPPPVIVGASPLPSATFGSAYTTTTETISGQYGVPPYTWSATGLPPGLFMNLNTGVISGTPTAVGAFTVTVTLTDAAAASQAANGARHVDQKAFALQVNGPKITVPDTDFVAVGTGGMRGSGSGTIVLSGISGTITQALLYWHGPTNSSDAAANATVTFKDNSVTGVNIGFAHDNNWAFVNSQAYRADVTSLVTGNGSYSLSNFRKAGPPAAEINGASLIVFFDDGDNTNNRDVYLLDVNDSNAASSFEGGGATGWNQTIAGINYSSGTAILQLHVSDGQKGANPSPARQWFDGAVVVNGTTIANEGHIFSGDSVQGGTTNPESNSTGGLWDIKSFDITSRLNSGTNTLTLTSPFLDDRLSLVVALVSVPHTGGDLAAGALNVDGLNDFVHIPQHSSLSLSTLTVEASVKIDSEDSVHRQLISKGSIGLLDKVRIWKVARTDNQIAAK